MKSLFLFVFREGRSNAHIKGDYQRIGDVMLKNLQALKVTPDLRLTLMCFETSSVSPSCLTLMLAASDNKHAQAVRDPS